VQVTSAPCIQGADAVTSAVPKLVMHMGAEQMSISICNVAKIIIHLYSTRMWANAQRDGRPAEYGRRLFNAAKFG